HPCDVLDGGRFWKIEEIKENLGKVIFTPNFEEELKKVSLIPSLSK
ncbi:NTP pyrophosphohydrolase, partial [Bacteroides ovatus]